MRVVDLCTQEVEVIAPAAHVGEAARRMRKASVGTVVVVDEIRRPLGILTDRDVATRVVGRARSARNTPVSKAMSQPVAWVHAERSVEDALAEMTRLRVRRLAVVDDAERLVGVLALDDILCAVLDEDSPLRAALQANL